MEIDSSKIGNLELTKGTLRNDIPLFIWDGIRDCTHVECPVVSKCKYIHRGKCAVQVNYIENLYKAVFNTYSYLDEAMAFKIGVEIIPLYVHLVRLQIVELALDNPVVTNEKGMAAIHPVFKEIRSTLQCIHSMWKSLDMVFMFGEKAKLAKKPKKEDDGGGKIIDYERGDPNFYQKISTEGASREGVIR